MSEDHVGLLDRGETYNHERDGLRLAAQYDKVFALMKDGAQRTLGEIAYFCGAPEASCSARLRQIRANGYTVNRTYVRRGLHLYSVTK